MDVAADGDGAFLTEVSESRGNVSMAAAIGRADTYNGLYVGFFLQNFARLNQGFGVSTRPKHQMRNQLPGGLRGIRCSRVDGGAGSKG